MQVIDSKPTATVTHDTTPVLCDAAGRPKKLQQLVADAIAVRHYSRRTQEAYWHWIKRFLLWSGKRHPRDMGQAEFGQFLTWLASDQGVSASTQRQALAAVLFLYQKVLGIEIGWIDNVVRAKQSQRLPVVMTVDEVRALLAHTSGTPGLFLRLLYGTGLRLMEGLNLRVKDLDLVQRQIIVRAGKGNKDRVTMLPAALVAAAEREECAKVCDAISTDKWALYKGHKPYTGQEPGRAAEFTQGQSDGADLCEQAIRARGTK